MVWAESALKGYTVSAREHEGGAVTTQVGTSCGAIFSRSDRLNTVTT